MAENENILSRLGKLFQSDIVVRKRDNGQLVVKDLDYTKTSLTSNFIDRYTKIVGAGTTWGAKYAARQNKSNYDVQRRELFNDYEVMDSDPIIASALDIYSDESTIDNVENEILTIRSDNPKITEILHNLFYDILNIEFNLWSWIRNLTKYGDFYLQMDILDKYGVVNVKPLSPYEVIRLEDHDPENPKRVEFELQNDDKNSQYVKRGEKVLLQSYEVAHFRLMSDANFLPYGKSMLEGARKVWKQLTLMEDAMMIHRIMRAPEKRVFKVDIGNIPPNEVDNFMQRIINKMKKIPVIDQKTGEYNLRYNVESTTEDYYLPVRGGDSGTNIETLPGLSNDNAIEDIEYLRNKMMAALKIPKAFLGYDESIGSKATLAAEDVRFSRTIERLQKIIVSELSKIAIVHLYTQGFDDADLIDFNLELTNPSMIHMQEKMELITQKTDLANSMMENKIVSRQWVYDNIFEFSNVEKKEIFEQMVEDQKQKFRFEQIETEGNDPVESGASAEDMEEQSGDWGGDRRSGTAEKEYGNEYDSEDLSDATKYERERYGKREFKHKSPLHPGKGSTLVKSEMLKRIKQQFNKDINKMSILNEEAIIDEKEI